MSARAFAKGAGRALAWGALALLLLLSLAILLPKLFSLDCYAITTGSMGSTLPTGSLIYTEQVPFEEIAAGDIVCFFDPDADMAFTHRVVSVDADSRTFRTMGDGNGIEDPASTPYSYSRGKVVFALPGLGFLTIVLRSPLAPGAVAALLLVFVLAEIFLTRREKKHRA